MFVVDDEHPIAVVFELVEGHPGAHDPVFADHNVCPTERTANVVLAGGDLRVTPNC